MANEIFYSTLGDLRLTEVMSQVLLLTLADRQALQAHPSLVYVGDAMGSGSLTKKIGEIGWLGADQLTSTAEGISVANTPLTDGSFTVTIARHAKAYSTSDLARLTDPGTGMLDPASFAQDATASAAMTMTNLIAALMPGFTQSVGASGVDMTVTNWYEAVGLLRVNNVQGPYLSILHAQQYNDFSTSLRSETGVLHLQEATAEQQVMKGTGFMGSFNGVDIFVSNQVPTVNAGADRGGGMFGRGAVLWGDGSFKPDPSVIGFDLGKVRLEFDRDGRLGETAAITNYNLGVAEGIDLAGVEIATDA